jgi:hypothetical protein
MISRLPTRLIGRGDEEHRSHAPDAASATARASNARPTPPRIWRGSTNSLFKSSVPGASPGRERDDTGNLPVGLRS